MSSPFEPKNDMKNAPACYATARNRYALKTRFEPNIGMKNMPAYSATADTNRFVPETRFEPKIDMINPPAYSATAYTNRFVPETPVEPKIDMITLPAYSETGNAEHDIASIAVHAFANIYNYRCATPRMWKTFTAKEMVERQIIASADANINRIMIASSPHKWIDREDSSKQIDYAIWRLLTMVSTLEDPTGEIDRTAAYVMMDLLYPLKSDTLIYGGNSLLYKTLRFIDFKFGVGLFGTILLRNDQRFRKSELNNEVIRKFEIRYKTKLAGRFIAKC